MRKVLLASLLAVISSLYSDAQTITGKVTDEYDIPLAYANIILQKEDHSYIDGTITDTTGRFSIVGHQDAAMVQISFIGYETVYRTLDNLETIKLTPDTEVIGKSVVKATLPKTEIKGDAFVTKIENSILSEAGSASDVLIRLPGVTYKDEDYEVFGKGTPQIYINGRLVRDNAELEQLNSNEIRNVEVVQNPGATYHKETGRRIRLRPSLYHISGRKHRPDRGSKPELQI